MNDAPGDDLVFDTLWGRVLEAWTDEKVHAAFLDYALREQRLPQAAGRYRALRDDPERGELAQKKMGAVVLAAESLLLAAKTPRAVKVPWQITFSALGIVAVLLFWAAYAMVKR